MSSNFFSLSCPDSPRFDSFSGFEMSLEAFQASLELKANSSSSRAPSSPFQPCRNFPDTSFSFSASKSDCSLEGFALSPIGSPTNENSSFMSPPQKEAAEKVERAASPVFLPPVNKRKTLAPPPTPHGIKNKRRRVVITAKSYEKAQEYNECQKSELQKALQRNHSSCSIKVGDFIGEGEFSKVYLLSWNEDDKQVIKIPNFKNEFNERSFLVFRKHEIINYFELKRAGFPVVPYFNLDEMAAQSPAQILGKEVILDMYSFNDKELEILSQPESELNAILGFYFSQEELEGLSSQQRKSELETILLLKLKGKILEQLIKDGFDGFYRTSFIRQEFLSFEALDRFNDLLASKDFEKALQDENHPLYQLKEMFKLAYEKGIAVDLKRDNVRIQENGKVVLCDLYYDNESDFEDENPFHCLVEQKLKTFAAPDSRVWKYLDPRPIDVSGP